MLGTVDGNDLCRLGGLPGGDLREVFGVLAEEIDTLYPNERQYAEMDGTSHELADYCEVVHPESAEVLATYSSDWYRDTPAVTRNRYGKGLAVYQACRDTGSLKEQILEGLLAEAGIESLEDTKTALPHGVTAHSRTDGEHTYLFLENYLDTPVSGICMHTQMQDMLSGETNTVYDLPPFGFRVLKD
jgi:beta-galactosidase